MNNVMVQVIPEPFRQTAVTLVEVCAYAGTGNVLKIQQLLHICSEHYEQDKGETEKKDKKKDDKKDGEKKDGDKKAEEEKKEEDGPLDLSGQQAVAVLGLGQISKPPDALQRAHHPSRCAPRPCPGVHLKSPDD